MNPAIEPLKKKVNSLRPESWGRLHHFTHAENYALMGALQTLESMEDSDWSLIRAFFAYTPRGREQHVTVKKRESFLNDPAGTLTCATEWARTHREEARQANPEKPQGHWR